MCPPHTTLRLALAQLNPIVGDVQGNAALAKDAIQRAAEAGADLVVLPELTISGYPPEDLLLRADFLDACEDALAELAAGVSGTVALVGCPIRDTALHNSLAVIADGEIVATYRKVLLPNYGVFDERRYFEPGPCGEVIQVGGVTVGLTICEDIWTPGPPATAEAESGARLIVNASASPYHRAKGTEREAMVARRAREGGVTIALCNMVGGQDELVFDGHSVVVDSGGRTVARGAQFESELILCDLELEAGTGSAEPSTPTAATINAGSTGERASVSAPLHEPLSDLDEVYSALVLGLGDYVGKNGFEEIVLGLSGGIDSALVALLASDALGPERVNCVIMPSPHSSDDTQSDARVIAANLGCPAIEFDIGPLMSAYDATLAEAFAETTPGVAEENLQARIRGNLVMALSNKFGWLPLTTGNKSEMSVGYTTLYGDMAGGFAVIKDVPKILVYELVASRNARDGGEPPIPASVLERAPSAELRPDQRDEDSLPPYEILDAALADYVERDGSMRGLIADGFAPEVAERVVALVDQAEYKRRQAPPGVKITTKAFGRDRRLPITNRWRG